HYLLATAFDADDKDQALAAYGHFRQSLKLDPNQADCLSEFGVLALRLHKDAEGLRALRRAAELTPVDGEVLDKLVQGLLRCGKLEDARLTLRAALFRNPGTYAFQKLWSDFRFHQACETQQAARQHGEDHGETEEPVLLPFLRLAGRASTERP